MKKTLRELVGFDLLYDIYLDKEEAKVCLTLDKLSAEDLQKVIPLGEDMEVQDEAINQYVKDNLPNFLSKEEAWSLIEDYVHTNESSEEVKKFVDITNSMYETLTGIEALLIEVFSSMEERKETLQ